MLTIHKYKSFENNQIFEAQDDITILVGMNEPGKTSVLEPKMKSKLPINLKYCQKQ